MIELEHVTRFYGHVLGVNDLTVTIPPGAHGLLGPNGSGKTTLIHLIAGQLRPSIGRVRVFGEDPRHDPRLLARLGYCPALDPGHWGVSALEWVAYLLELAGFGAAEAQERARDALVQMELGDHLNRPMHTYSLGMRQRVKLAQALAHDPDWLILDEPFNGLDPLGRHTMTQRLRRWIEEGKSLLLASHVLHEVEAITDSFLLLFHGRLLASGRAADMAEWLRKTRGTVIVHGARLRPLAARLAADPRVEGVKLAEGDTRLTIEARLDVGFFHDLDRQLEALDLVVDEIETPHDRLADIFTSLVRIHRGEVWEPEAERPAVS